MVTCCSNDAATLVGLTLVGLTLVGLTLVGLTLVGLTLVGLTLVGLTLVGLTLVGLTLVGLTLVGLTLRATVEAARGGGSSECGGTWRWWHVAWCDGHRCASHAFSAPAC